MMLGQLVMYDRSIGPLLHDEAACADEAKTITTVIAASAVSPRTFIISSLPIAVGRV